MPKEGKNDRFARRVCESLKLHLAAPWDYIGAPNHVLKQKTSFGYQAIGVHLWGANAPHRHLEFMLGVWYDAYEAARLRLGLEPTLKGAFHFWQTTGNLAVGWAGFKIHEGRWEANLNEDPAPLMPEMIPYLSNAMRTFFDTCAVLRTIRKLVEPGGNGPLFTTNPWQETVVIDVTLADWEHLKSFVQRKDLPYFQLADPKLIERIEGEFGVKCSNVA